MAAAIATVAAAAAAIKVLLMSRSFNEAVGGEYPSQPFRAG
jgi:hypothetical protein